MIDHSELIDTLTSVGLSKDEIQTVLDVESGKSKGDKAFYEIITKMIHIMRSHTVHQDKKTNVGFVPGIPVAKVFNTASSIPGLAFTDVIDSALRMGSEAASSGLYSNTGVQISPDVISKTANDIFRLMGPDMKASGFMGGGGETTSGGSTNPYAPQNATGFTFIPKPLEIRFKPNVPNTVYGEVTVGPNQELSSNLQQNIRARMHINSIELKLPSFSYGASNAAGKVVRDYFTQVFVPNLQIRAQGNVSFNIQASNHLSPDKLIKYFNDVINALSLYYFYAHTYAYCSVSENRNMGMYEMRDIFTTSDVQNLRLLEERLNGLPIPPRLNELCYWMFDVYRSSSVAGSDIIRNAPFKFAGASEGSTIATLIDGGDGLIISALNRLSGLDAAGTVITNNHNRVTSDYLARICPNWVNVKVGSSTGLALHDPSFSTLFWNQPVAYGTKTNADSVATVEPIFSSLNEEYAYNAYCEELDGVIQSLFSWFDASTGVLKSTGWLAALPSVIGNEFVNRFTYADGNAGTGFYSYRYTPNMRNIRQDTYAPAGAIGEVVGNIIGTNICDAVPVLGMSVSSVAQASVNTIGYLLDIGGIGTDAPLKAGIDKDNPMNASGRGRRRKRK
jgi:hypothetical protein